MQPHGVSVCFLRVCEVLGHFRQAEKHSLYLTKVLGQRRPHPKRQSSSLVLLCIGGVHGSHASQIMMIVLSRQGMRLRDNDGPYQLG